MSKRCPSCRTVVDDDASVCPNCPWIFPDEMTSARMEKTVPAPWSPLPMLILAGVALAIAGGWIVFVKTVGRSDREPPAAPQSALAPAVPAAIPEAPPQKAAEAARHPVVPAPEADDAALVAVPVVKSAPAVKEWRLRGHVYDLMTLKPVTRCAVILSDLETDKRFETATDDAGLYRAILPSLPGRGYSIRLAQADYVPTYVDPATLDVPRKPAAERRHLCRELATAVRELAALQPPGLAPLVTDFYLAPLSCL